MNGDNSGISGKLEDYILTVFRLTNEHGHAHLGDLARLRGVKNSSANSALNSLCEKGLVEYEKYRPIVLTPKGREMALKMLERRDTLMKFFVDTLGVEKDEAKKTVCKVEHIFEDALLARLSKFAGTKSAAKNRAPKKFLSQKLD